MKSVFWFFAGLGAAAALAQFASWRRARIAEQALDLNTISRESLLELPGIDDDLAERILDNRPYRSKFDLLNRLVVPDTVYRQIKNRIFVDDQAAHQAIRTA